MGLDEGSCLVLCNVNTKLRYKKGRKNSKYNVASVFCLDMMKRFSNTELQIFDISKFDIHKKKKISWCQVSYV